MFNPYFTSNVCVVDGTDMIQYLYLASSLPLVTPPNWFVIEQIIYYDVPEIAERQ